MTTETTYRPVTVTKLDHDGWDTAELLNEGITMAAVGFTFPAFGQLPDDHPAELAWERDVVDAASREIIGQVRDLLVEAIERRLPWTWEQER